MANRMKDFDNMFSEMKKETIPFKVYGKTYEIYKEIPAVIVLEMARHEDSDNMPSRLLFQAAEAIFGRETLDELCKQRDFSIVKLSKMVEWAFKAINGTDEDDEPEGVTEDDTGAVERKN